MFEFETPNLLGKGGKQCHIVNGLPVIICGDVQGGSLYASEKSLHEELVHVPSQVQLGPKCGMLREGSTPVTAHESGPEAITQRIKMDGNEAEDIQWEAVDVD